MSRILSMLATNIAPPKERAEGSLDHMGKRATVRVIVTALGVVWYVVASLFFPDAVNPSRPQALLRNFRPLMPGPP